MKAYFIGGPLDLTVKHIEDTRPVLEALTAPRILTGPTSDEELVEMEMNKYTYRYIGPLCNVEHHGNDVALYVCNPE